MADVPTPRSQIASPIQTSLEPEVAVRGGTPEEHRRLKQALDRFASNGLRLPELEVEFRDDGELHQTAGRDPPPAVATYTDGDSACPPSVT